LVRILLAPRVGVGDHLDLDGLDLELVVAFGVHYAQLALELVVADGERRGRRGRPAGWLRLSCKKKQQRRRREAGERASSRRVVIVSYVCSVGHVIG